MFQNISNYIKGKRTQWVKAANLKVGAAIAVADTNKGEMFWDEIISIKKVGREKVYDIEVEGTHNFVGNDIVAHNTYINGNLGIGISSPTAPLHVGTTASGGLSGIFAGRVQGVGGTNTNEFVTYSQLAGGGGPWSKSSSNVYLTTNTDYVGIGTTGPVNKLDVFGNMAIGSYAGVYAAPSNGLIISGSVGIGITSPGSYKLNVQGGINTAIYGQSSSSYGVYGTSTDSSGVYGTSTAAYGVYGYVNSSTGRGVYGRNAGSGTGVYGYSDSGEAGLFYSNSGYGLIVEKGSVGIGTTSPIGPLHINIGATPAFVVTSTGNIGIGTTNPTQKLQVAGSILVDSTVYYTDTSYYDNYNTKRSASSTGLNLESVHASTSKIVFKTGTTPSEVMRIDSSGNVGIGTTGPGYKLHVVTTGQEPFKLENSDSALQRSYLVNTYAGGVQVDINFSNNSQNTYLGQNNLGGFFVDNRSTASNIIRFQDYGVDKMVIDTSGNVGIGTTNPTAHLQVYSTTAGGAQIYGYSNATTGVNQGGNFEASGAGATTNVGGYFYASGATNNYGIQIYAPAAGANNYAIYSAAAAQSYIAGNVGIGTVSPTAKLHLVGSNTILNVGDTGGNSLFTVTDTLVTSNLPTSFTASGDVSIAYDLNFTNATSSYIKSVAPLYLQSGETFNSSDLTLKTFNYGDLVFEAGVGVTSAGGTIKFYDSNIKGATVSTPIAFADTSTKINTFRTNYADETVIGALNEAYAMAIGSSGGIWTDGGTYIYPTTAGSTAVAILDSGNVGIGTTAPNSKLVVASGHIGLGSNDIEAWSGIGSVIESIDTSIAFGTDTDIHITGNAYFDGAWKYKTTDEATNYYQYQGAHNWRVAPSGTLNTAITWTNAMTINSVGNVGIGTTSPTAKLHVEGGIVTDYVASTIANMASGLFVGGEQAVTARFGFGVQGGFFYQGSNDASNQNFDFRAPTADGSLGTINVRIQSSGNVGIGTTAPGAKLEVQVASGTNVITNFSGLQAANTTGHHLTFNGGVAGTTARGYIGYGKTGSGAATIFTGESADSFSIRAQGDLHLGGTGDNLAMTIKSGNVGIGTTGPNQKLSVTDTLAITNGSGIQYLLMGNQDSGGANKPGIIKSWNGGNFEIGYGNSWSGSGGTFTSNVHIDTTGNVGIGTTNPGYKLHVVGEIFTSTKIGIGATHATYNLFVSSGGIGVTGASSFSGNLGIGGTLTLSASTVVGSGTTALFIDSNNVVSRRGLGALAFQDSTASTYNWIANASAGQNIGDGSTLSFTGTNGLTTTSVGTSQITFGLGGTLTTNTNIGTSSFNLSFFGLGNTQSLYLKSNGLVGIGTTNPTSTLTLNWNGSTSTPVINIGSSSGWGYGINMSNTYIDNLDTFYLSDPGAGEGLNYRNTSAGWMVDVSPLDRSNADGNLNFYGTANNIALWRPMLLIGNTANYSTFSQSTNGNLNIATTGTIGHISFSPAGNVGIGTTNPLYKLDVNGDINTNSRIGIGGTDASFSFHTTSNGRFDTNLSVGGTTTLAGLAIGTTGTGTTAVFTDVNGNLYKNILGAGAFGNGVGTTYSVTNGLSAISTNVFGLGGTLTQNTRLNIGSTEAFYIAYPSGNVGIGTTGPGAPLSIVGSAFPVLETIRTTATTNDFNSGMELITRSSGDVTDGFGGGIVFALQDTGITTQLGGALASIGAVRAGADNTGDIVLRTYTAGAINERVRIQSSGNVGIGTINPQYKLQVNGAALLGLQNEIASGDSSTFTSSIGSWVRNLGNGTLVASGGKGVLANTDGVYGYWAYNVGLVTGKTYNISVKLKSVSGSTTAYFGDAISATKVSFTITGTETTYTGSFVAANSNFTVYNGSIQQFEMDDISIKEVGVLYVGDNGNVGIGTTSPGAPLHVKATTNETIRIQGAGTTGDASVGYLSFYDSNGTTRYGYIGDASAANDDIALRAETGMLRLSDSSGEVITLNNGNVGIGTTGPGGKLHVYTGASGATAGTNADELVLEGSSHSGLSILTPNTMVGSIRFGDPEDNDVGLISYSHASNYMSFETAGTERLRIGANGGISVGSTYTATDPGAGSMIISGNVGIGTTGPSQKLQVAGIAQADTAFYVGTGAGTQGGDDNLIRPTAASSWLNIKGGAGKGKITLGNEIVRITGGDAGYTMFGYGASSSTNVGTDGMKFTTLGGLSLGAAYVGTDPGAGSMIISGNVGIGTVSPGTRLTVADTSPILRLVDTQQKSPWAIGDVLGTLSYYTNDVTGIGAHEVAAVQAIAESANDTPAVGLGLWTGGFNSAATEKVRITNAGNVGIGTTGPAALLDLQSSTSGDNPFIIIRDDNWSNSDRKGIQSRSGATVFTRIDSYLHDSNQVDLRFSTYNNGANTDTVTFQSSGNVGIGTTGPGAKLEIANITAGINETLRFTYANAQGSGSALTWKANAGVETGRIEHALYADTGDTSGYLGFSLYNRGAYGEKVRILGNGNVGIGTTAPYGKLNVVAGNALSTGFALSTSDFVSGGGTGSIFGLKFGAATGNTYGAINAYTAGGGSYGNLILNEVSGNIGIGTTNPTSKLHVEGNCVTGDTLLPIVSPKEVIEMPIGTLESSSLDNSTNGPENEKTSLSENLTISRGKAENFASREISTIPIREVKGGEYVLSLDETTGKIVPAKIKGLLDMGIKPIYRLTTVDGKSIRTTGNHPYLARRNFSEGGSVQQKTRLSADSLTGNTISTYAPRLSTNTISLKQDYVKRIWTKVIYLNVGDEIAVQNGETIAWVKIRSIEELPAEQVYDIEVEGTHNFVGNGIVAHNTYINGTISGTKLIDTDNASGDYYLDPALSDPTNSSSLSLYRDGAIRFNANDASPVSHILTGAAAQIRGYSNGLLLASSTSTVAGNSITGWDNQLFLNVSGNVGIGTTNPGAKLDVIGKIEGGQHIASTANGAMKFTNNVDEQTFMLYGESHPSNALAYFGTDTYGMNISTASTSSSNYILNLVYGSSNAKIGSGGTSALYVRADGNVGINTTSPAYKLHVVGDALISTRLGIGSTNALYALNVGNTAAFNNLYTTGSVGIGTTAPGFKLDIDSSTNASSFRVKSSNTTSNRIFLEATAGNVEQHFLYTGNQDWVIGLDKANSNKFKISSADDAFGAGTKLTIDTSGNVGIGTTGPGSKLEIYSGTNARLTLNRAGAWAASPADIKFNTDSGGADYWTLGMQPDSTNNMYLNRNATNYMTFKDGGNVGIGTTNPGYKLDVNGNLRVGTTLITSEIGSTNSTNLFIHAGAGGKLILGAGGTGVGSTGNGSIYFYKSDGTTSAGRIDTSVAGGSGSEVLDQSVGTTGSYDYFYNTNSSNNRWPAQAFTVGSNAGNLNSVTLSLCKLYYDAYYDIWVDLYAADSVTGKPTGGVMSSSATKNTSAISTCTTFADYNFTFASSSFLEANTKYILVLKGNGVPDTNDATRWQGDGTASTDEYATGYNLFSTDSLGTWTLNNSAGSYYDLNFKTYLKSRYGVLYIGGVNTDDADLAENYPSNQSLSPGELVAIDLDNPSHIVRATPFTNQKLLGVISNSPGLLLGNADNDTSPNKYPVALAGRVPVKITLENGHIEPGDPLTNSNTIDGKAQKATSPGFIIGKALDSSDSCTDPGNCTITALIQPNWYDPDTFLTLDTLGQIINSNPQSSDYKLRADGGSVINRMGRFSQVLIANLKAGIINTEIITPLSNIGIGSTLKIAGDVETTGSLFAQNIKTPEIKADSIETIRLSADTITAQDIGVTTLTAIDIQSQTATVSGTLYADQIISREGNFGDLMTQKISALRDEVKNIIASSTLTTPPEDVLLSQSESWLADISTESAQLTGSLSLTDNLVVGAQLAVAGQAELASALISGTFTAGQISIKDNLLETVASTLYIQPSKIGTVNIMGNTLIIADNGDVTVNGNLYLNGTLTAQTATISGSLTAYLITASDIQTTSVSTQKLNIISNVAIAQANPSESATESARISSNSTAGTTTLTAGSTEITIQNNQLTANSMVYLTPVGSTQNQVLYLKDKFISPTPSLEATASAEIVPDSSVQSSFTIAVDSPLDHDIQVNWWIIN